MTFIINFKKQPTCPILGASWFIARSKLEQLSVCYKNVNTKATFCEHYNESLKKDTQYKTYGKNTFFSHVLKN